MRFTKKRILVRYLTQKYNTRMLLKHKAIVDKPNLLHFIFFPRLKDPFQNSNNKLPFNNAVEGRKNIVYVRSVIKQISHNKTP